MSDPAGPVLVVGATGNLGGKVVDELLWRGKDVRAVVRPASDATRLEAKGRYVADVARQTQLFGPPPTAADAVARFAQLLGHSAAR